MRDFFKPWRRKIGVVTLGLALALLGSWFRSHRTFDVVPISVGDRQNSVISVEGRIYWFSWSNSALAAVNSGTSEHPIENARTLLGFGFQDSSVGFIASIPHWSIAIPLTLLSAYLLLVTPRSVTAMKTNEPAPTTGT